MWQVLRYCDNDSGIVILTVTLWCRQLLCHCDRDRYSDCGIVREKDCGSDSDTMIVVVMWTLIQEQFYGDSDTVIGWHKDNDSDSDTETMIVI